MTLGEKIQWGRRRSGLSQQQLAERLCVSRSAVAKWETDKGLPDVDNLRQLSKLLHMTVDNLLSEEAAAVSEPCSYADFPGCSRVQKDILMRHRFPDATVTPLLGKPEAPFACSRGQQAFYLVETRTEQLLVSVTEGFLELRPIAVSNSHSSFHANGWHFLRLHPI